MTKSPPPAIAERDAQRLDSVDAFRGFAIIGMVLVDIVSRIRAVPAWLKHAPEGAGLTLADTIAPMFIFAIGLTFGRSMKRRIAENGEREAYLHFLRRGLAILGFGVFFTFPGHYWGLFQFIGSAVLLTLLVIRLPIHERTAVGAGLLFSYPWLLARYGTDVADVWGGLRLSLGWTGMLILSTVLADLFHDPGRRLRWYPTLAVVAVLLGAALRGPIPLSLLTASTSYVLVNLGISALLFAAFQALTGRAGARLRLLTAWGRNPLILYFVHYWAWIWALLGPKPEWWHKGASPALATVQAMTFLLLMSAVAWWLDRRGWIVSL